MKVALFVLLAGISCAQSPVDWSAIRKPTLQGLVVMPPGNFDSNVCLDDNGRWNGGGFYLQNLNGGGQFVCPSTASLVTGVSYGDVVEVVGETMSGPQGILTVRAETVTPLNRVQQEAIDTLSGFDEYNNVAQFGDLVQLEGFVTDHVVTFDGYGSIFTMTDCDGNTAKLWWTQSINASVNAQDLFQWSEDSNWQPSYFQMVGFKEDYNPLCWTGTRVAEFQPRFVSEIVEITAPCTVP